MNRYVTPLFFMLLSVGIYIEYIDPALGKIQTDRAKIEEYKKFIEEANEAQHQIDALKQKQKEFPAGYDQALLTILPPSVDSTRLIIDVDGVAQLRGLSIKGPTVSSEDDGSGYKKHALSFGVKAPYSVFRSFLRDLEASLALRDFSSVSFSSSVAQDDFTAARNPELRPLEYTITIITYSRGS